MQQCPGHSGQGGPKALSPGHRLATLLCMVSALPPPPAQPPSMPKIWPPPQGCLYLLAQEAQSPRKQCLRSLESGSYRAEA